MNIPDISEKNFEEAIEQALLAALPQVELNPARLEIGQPAPLYGALTANLASGDVAPGGYVKRLPQDELEPLSQIISELNEHFGTGFSLDLLFERYLQSVKEK